MEFVLASTGSVMQGKRLTREEALEIPGTIVFNTATAIGTGTGTGVGVGTGTTMVVKKKKIPVGVVSFVCTDGLCSIVLTPNSNPISKQLVHFDKKENFEYPYICLPLLWDVDSAAGTYRRYALGLVVTTHL